MRPVFEYDELHPVVDEHCMYSDDCRRNNNKNTSILIPQLNARIGVIKMLVGSFVSDIANMSLNGIIVIVEHVWVECWMALEEYILIIPALNENIFVFSVIWASKPSKIDGSWNLERFLLVL